MEKVSEKNNNKEVDTAVQFFAELIVFALDEASSTNTDTSSISENTLLD